MRIKMKLNKITKKVFKLMHKNDRIEPMFTKWKTIAEVLSLINYASQRELNNCNFPKGRNDVNDYKDNLKVEIFESEEYVFCVKHYIENDKYCVITYRKVL